MTKTLSLKDARNQFSDIVDRAGRLSERIVVTKNGRPEAVVMGAGEFESWVERKCVRYPAPSKKR